MTELPTVIVLGTLAAHSQSIATGFRQREIRFYSELFSNWIEVGGLGATIFLHNTQIARHITQLVHEGFAKSLKRGTGRPTYKLTKAGLFSLLSQLVHRSYLKDRLECHLVWYFLRSYTPQLQVLFGNSDSGLSIAQQRELEEYLNISDFIANQIRHVDTELKRLEERVNVAFAIAKEVQQMLARRQSIDECVAVVSKKYPYELNAQRSFSDLLKTLPPNLLVWELTKGSAIKARFVFEPLKTEILRFKEQLLQMKQEATLLT